MKSIFKGFLIVCLQFPVFGGGTFTGTVTSVADGDTIVVSVSASKQYRIRLNGIDAPETKQIFGDKSRDALSVKVYRKRVTVVWSKIDEYQRLLADIYLGSNHVNLNMVIEGWAWHYAYYSNNSKLAAAQVSARNTRKGLWAGKNPVAPWDWRKKQKTSNSAYRSPSAFRITKSGINIVSLLPNPKGKDEGAEQVTLINNSNKATSLKGWALRDKARNTFKLSGNIPANGKLTITMKSNSMPLNNDGDTITLLQGKSVRQNFTYNKQQAKTGQVVKSGKK